MGRSALNESFEPGPTSAGLQLFPDLQHDTESKYLDMCKPVWQTNFTSVASNSKTEECILWVCFFNFLKINFTVFYRLATSSSQQSLRSIALHVTLTPCFHFHLWWTIGHEYKENCIIISICRRLRVSRVLIGGAIICVYSTLCLFLWFIQGPCP